MKALKRKKNPRLFNSFPRLVVRYSDFNSLCDEHEKCISERDSKRSGNGLRKCNGQVSTTVCFVFAFLVPLIVIFVLYTKIAFFLHQRIKIGMMHEVAARSNSKAVRMLTVAVLAGALFLGPAAFFAMLRSYGLFKSFSFGDMLNISWAIEFLTMTSSLGKSNNLCVL